MKKCLIGLAVMTLTTLCSPCVSASQPFPEVACTAAIDGDAMVQLDCWGEGMAESYERFVPVRLVNEALVPIASEWTYSLTWVEVK